MLTEVLAQMRTESTSPSEAGDRYLQQISRDRRLDQGQVYTPADLVSLILDLADFGPASDLTRLTVLDPACGAGAFLTEATERIAQRLLSSGTNLSSRSGAERLASVIECALFGVDKDPGACILSIEAVRLHFRALTQAEPPRGFFSRNVLNADFLLDDLSRLSRAAFDLVVGNPPYVAATRLTSGQKTVLQERYYSANGRIDLYTLFFERGINLLKPGGVLAYVSPDKYLTSESGKRLRSLMSRQCTVRRLALFKSHRIFPDAATVPCVSVLQKVLSSTPAEILEFDYRESGAVPSAARTFSHPQPPIGSRPWHFSDSRIGRIAAELLSSRTRLSDFSSRVSAGIATGRDAVFVVDPDVARGIEPELLRPAVRGRDLAAYSIRDPHLNLLVPYAGTPDRPALAPIDSYPGAHSYLSRYRDLLEQRHCVRVWHKEWFDLHDTWSRDLASLPKILVPDVAACNRFVFDPGRYVPLHSAYYVVPTNIDGEVLATILNSEPIEFLVRLRAPRVKDGFSRYRRQFLVSLPIPYPSAATARELLKAAQERDSAAVNDIAARLFELETPTVAVIRDYLARERAGPAVSKSNHGR